MTKPVRDYLERSLQDATFAAAYQNLEDEFEAERLRIQACTQSNTSVEAQLDVRRYPDLLRLLDWLEQLSQSARWTSLLAPTAQPFYAEAGYQVSGDAVYDATTVTVEATY